MKIVISAVLALFLIGCSSDDSKQAQNAEPMQIAQNADEEMLVQDVDEKVVVQDAEEEVLAQDADEKMVLQDADEERVIEDKEDPMEVGIVEDVVVAETSVEYGAEIYKLCSTCHGENAEKSALGKSKIIQGWSADQVTEALNGYKDGSYGGPMKGLMKGQANKLSDEDIELVAEYISTL